MDKNNPYNIKTYNAIAPAGLQRFAAGNYVVGPDTQSPDGMLLRSCTAFRRRIDSGIASRRPSRRWRKQCSGRGL